MSGGARRRYAYRECQGCDATVYQLIASADADGVLSIIRLPVRTLGGDGRTGNCYQVLVRQRQVNAVTPWSSGRLHDSCGRGGRGHFGPSAEP